jgi:hypothetical protein
MPTKNSQETLKRHKKGVSSRGAFRSTLRAEKETQCIGTNEREQSLTQDKEAVDAASRKLETKPWNRLDRGHRIQKIREWVNRLDGDKYPDSLKDEIRSSLVRAIQRKEITTNACVEYDTETCKVTGVPALMIVEGDSVTEGSTRVIIRRPEKKTKKRRKTTSS